MELLTNILFAMIRVSTPLILAGLAGVISQQVNLLNIAIDGLMLFGAFAAVVVGAYFGNVWIGLLAAMIMAILISIIFSVFVIDLRANLIVAGVAVNTLALGLTSFLLVIFFNARGAYSPGNLAKLPSIDIPLLQDIPFLGDVLSGHSVLAYVSWLLVFGCAVLLYRTRLGVHIRAVGEHTEAAETAGINVRKVRYISLLVAGALAGLAGAQLAVGDLTLFTDNMTNGRGFIALAAVFFGGAKPGLTALGALLFGLFESVQVRLQTNLGFPPQLVQMLPYLIVVVVLTVMSVQKKRKRKI